MGWNGSNYMAGRYAGSHPHITIGVRNNPYSSSGSVASEGAYTIGTAQHPNISTALSNAHDDSSAVVEVLPFVGTGTLTQNFNVTNSIKLIGSGMNLGTIDTSTFVALIKTDNVQISGLTFDTTTSPCIKVGGIFDEVSDTVSQLPRALAISGDGVSVVVGTDTGGTPMVEVSTDGVNFAPATTIPLTGTALTDIAWDTTTSSPTNRFLAISLFPTATVIESTDDGVNWATIANNPSTAALDIAFNPTSTRYATCDSNGRVESTDDYGATAWVVREAGGFGVLGTALASDVTSTTWVMVGQAGTIGISTNNAVTWNVATSSGLVTDDLQDVETNGTTWVAVGDAGTILTSTNGGNWSDRTFGETDNFIAVAWVSAASAWVALTDTGKVFFSEDEGTTWHRDFLLNANLGGLSAALGYDATNNKILLGEGNTPAMVSGDLIVAQNTVINGCRFLDTTFDIVQPLTGGTVTVNGNISDAVNSEL